MPTTPVVREERQEIGTITPAAPLSGPMVIATLSRPQPDTAVCRVTGSVDMATAPVLGSRLIEAIQNGRPHLVVDLSGVTLLDSIGLQAVLETLDQYDIAGHLAVVIDARTARITRRELSVLSELIDIHHDMASALRACARASVSTGGRHRAKITA